MGHCIAVCDSTLVTVTALALFRTISFFLKIDLFYQYLGAERALMIIGIIYSIVVSKCRGNNNAAGAPLP